MQKNAVTVYDLVRDRLEHIELIFELRHSYCNLDLVKPVGDNGWTHPWRYFEGLIHYLLLTCFDLLGQPSEWVSFSEWLNSDKKKAERCLVESCMPVNSPPLEITKHFNSEYQKMYGVRTSFNNFVLEIISDTERAELYTNIEIVRGRMDGEPNTCYPALGLIDNDNKKLEFLFSLRNKFTHTATVMGSPAAGVFPHIYDWFVIDGVAMKGYSEIYREEKNGEWLIYQVRDWPFSLIRLIKTALSRNESQKAI
ncbi:MULTISPECIES: hypothetical protein [unclassified Acidovorax]|uniref:hypothetical protein n=1 Tax=unclassified Acidovorax TaxID=2684926 RepID=UPI002883298E|nr:MULTISPECIES: hypothetical protein [unclassified Acidovorax]